MIITALTVDHLAAVRELLTLGAPYIRARDSSDYWLYASLFASTCPLLRDIGDHHGRGVRDANDDPGESGCRIGAVSLVIGEVPGMPVLLPSATGLAHTAGVRQNRCLCGSRTSLDLAINCGAASLSVEDDHCHWHPGEALICR